MVITVVVKAHWKKKDQSRRSKHRKWCILILPFVVTTTANNHKSPIQVTVYVFSSLNHPHYFGLVSPHPVTVYLVIDFFFCHSFSTWLRNPIVPPCAFLSLSCLSNPKSLHLACGCVYWACVYMCERECACYLLRLLFLLYVYVSFFLCLHVYECIYACILLRVHTKRPPNQS